MLLINEIKLHIDEDESKLKSLIEKKLKAKINSFEIKRKSIDARKEPVYVYSVLVDVDNEEKYASKDIHLYHKENLEPLYKDRNKTVIVVGYGPSGIFSAYRLCKAGFKVIVFEKGSRIHSREKDVETFFKTGILNPESNVQFGEGGAGTFSDAKLTTRIKDKYIEYISDIFIRHGADKSIKYVSHAHIGTDEIRKIIMSITDYLIENGVEFHFDEALKDIITVDKKVKGIITDKGEYYGDEVLLGIGHSSYETVLKLIERGLYTESKDISIGFRVEHPQLLIDSRQTSNMIEEANEYFLRYKGEKGVYSFCMCPGGLVVPAMSDPNTIVTNGMSYSKRDSGTANSAILIQVFKEEFVDGYEYLHNIERNAYNYSDSYKALSQNIKDFMNNELNPLIRESTYSLGTVLYDFNNFLPEKDINIIKEAFNDFDRKIPGFISEGIMVGPETRSSCPIRMKRNADYESVSLKHLYPMGEGAGYGGGIMSCALDGIRIANALISKYE
ncbi:MAG: hypothetical protein Q4D13_03380 [Erysipelotrichaceae bacterium]|nr:hypothetical protein [Erysipelotrichaceae bacterium]